MSALIAGGGVAAPALPALSARRFSVAAWLPSGNATATRPRTLQATPHGPIAVSKTQWLITNCSMPKHLGHVADESTRFRSACRRAAALEFRHESHPKRQADRRERRHHRKQRLPLFSAVGGADGVAREGSEDRKGPGMPARRPVLRRGGRRRAPRAQCLGLRGAAALQDCDRRPRRFLAGRRGRLRPGARWRSGASFRTTSCSLERAWSNTIA